jgi:hypothetical protein
MRPRTLARAHTLIKTPPQIQILKRTRARARVRTRKTTTTTTTVDQTASLTYTSIDVESGGIGRFVRT